VTRLMISLSARRIEHGVAGNSSKQTCCFAKGDYCGVETYEK
jgi:hypothetical protein